jgi:hypothetical protein
LGKMKKEIKKEEKEDVDQVTYKWDLVWRNIIGMGVLHWFALSGIYYWFTWQCHWQSVLFGEENRIVLERNFY